MKDQPLPVSSTQVGQSAGTRARRLAQSRTQVQHSEQFGIDRHGRRELTPLPSIPSIAKPTTEGERTLNDLLDALKRAGWMR